MYLNVNAIFSSAPSFLPIIRLVRLIAVITLTILYSSKKSKYLKLTSVACRMATLLFIERHLVLAERKDPWPHYKFQRTILAHMLSGRDLNSLQIVPCWAEGLQAKYMLISCG